MGASLHAPLAALMAILELTANPHTLLPGMAAVIPALLVARSVFGQGAIFVALLRGRGLEYRFDPVALSLERTGVSATMNRRFARAALEADATVLEQVLATAPDWLLVTQERDVVGVVRPPALDGAGDEAGGDAARSALGQALRAAPRFIVVSPHATLREAMQRLDESGAALALVCEDAVSRGGDNARVEQVRGILERAALDLHSR
jgi:hypothetical protein